MTEEQTFKFYGYSVGDSSVGIPMLDFQLDTGIELSCYDDKDKDCFTEQHLTRTNILKGFDKALKEFFGYKKKISAIQFYSFMIQYLLRDLHDNGRVVVYDNFINKEWEGEE